MFDNEMRKWIKSLDERKQGEKLDLDRFWC